MTHTLHHGGERIAEALLAHGVSHLFTLCGGHISPILAAAKARGLRVVDVRDEATAVFAADASARLTGRPGVAAVTAGPGITNTLTALKNAQLAQSPLLLLGGAAPTALQGRGALQDIDQQPLVAPHVKRFYKLRRVADLAPAVVEAFALAQAGVPGPVFIECPVDLLYDAATVRQWYADAAGKGTAVADRALRWVLQRHTERMFAGSAAPYLPKPQAPPAPRATDSSIQAALAALRHSQRPLLVIGSQAVVRAAQVHTLAAAVQRLGIPVYLSGMARGLLGRGRALQMRHQRRHALREADCVLLAGVPCDFRLDYGRHVRRGATLIAANRSNRDAQLNRRPDILALGDAGDFITALADALTAPNSGWAGWCDTLRERDRHKRGLYLSAARSHLFNRYLAARIIDGSWDQALPGEVLMLDGSHSVFACPQPDATILERLARHDLHPSGPLWGAGESLATAAALAGEAALAAAEAQLCAGLAAEGLKQERRALRLVPAQLHGEAIGEAAVQFEFTLPAGAYATTVLHELVGNPEAQDDML